MKTDMKMNKSTVRKITIIRRVIGYEFAIAVTMFMARVMTMKKR